MRLHSSRVLLPEGLRPATVDLADGRIRGVFPGRVLDGLDLGDQVLAPALTDSHVHINEPGRTEWEGFVTATRAAAAGGATLLMDMPLNSDPVTTSVAALEEKKASTAGKLWVDVGFWGGVVPGNEDQLAPMVRAGASGFKCFTCFSGIDDFPASGEQDIARAMPILRACGVPLLVHAELEGPLREAPPSLDPRSYAAYLHSRPPEWEDAAVAMIARLVEQTGCPAHIVHLSSAGALDILRDARARGLPLSAETCPHYLGLAAEEVPDGATVYKCAPPIRPRANQAALWAALADGTLDCVVTDHSPCVPALKRLDTGNFMDAWGGIASLQLGLRSVWTGARSRGLPLPLLFRWMSAATARLAGRDRRGVIAAGMEADLVAWEPEAEAVVEARELLFRHPMSPWIGRRLAGRVRTVWKAGIPVVEEGAVLPTPTGRMFLRGER